MSLPRVPLQLAERRLLLVSVDLLLVNAAVLIGLRLGAIRSHWPFGPAFLVQNIGWFIALSLLWFLLAAASDLFNLRVASDAFSSLYATSKVALQVLAIYAFVFFFLPHGTLPRHVLAFFAAISLVFIFIWRWVYATLFSRSYFDRRVVVVGAGWAGRTIVQAIKDNQTPGYKVLGFIDDDPAKRDQVILGLPVLGTSEDLLTVIRDTAVSEVVLAVTHNMGSSLLQAILNCQEEDIDVVPMHDLYEQITGRVAVEHIGPDWYVRLPTSEWSSGHAYLWVRRLLDLVLALIGLLLAIPLFPLIGLAIYLSSGRPIFYEQDRVGQGGYIFRLLKFRSMIPDAEAEGKAVWASQEDPRVTRVGRILRRTRLDETPQLLNVLRGDMSIVGPRPERPDFVAQLGQQIPFYRARHTVKPGLTGWAQVNYRYGDSVQDALTKLQYDLYYIKHRSLYLDLLILLKTVGVVVSLRGR